MQEKDIALNTEGYKVLTPSGYQDFTGVAFMGERPVFRIEFENGCFLETTGNHRLFVEDGSEIKSSDLRLGDKVLAVGGNLAKVTEVVDTGRVEAVYDLIDVKGGHRYYTNGILSHNCEFVSDDETLIEAMTLARLKYTDPVSFTGTVRWFKDPEPNKTYMLGLDPALGTGGDYAAIQVFELPGLVQVAEWQHNKTAPKGQIKILLQILTTIDQELRAHPDQVGDPAIYWTVENNSIGEAALVIIEDTGEHNFPGTFVSEKRRPGVGRRRKGMNTSNSSKLAACAKFKSLLETDRMKINSRELVRQLKNFVGSGASYAAKPGEKDDLVMSTMLIVRMLETVINWIPAEESDELRDGIDTDDLFSEPMPILIG